MSGRQSLGLFEAGGVKVRGNIKTFVKGHRKKNFESNADGTTDFSEENVFMTLVIEMSVISDAQVEAVKGIKEKDGVLLFQTNGQKMRLPSVSFADMGEIGPEGKCDVTFSGPPASGM